MTGITPSLTEGVLHLEAEKLLGNQNICFQGYLTRGMGFVVSEAEADEIFRSGGEKYRQVVAPFLNGEDIVKQQNQSPSRWVIDFADLPLEIAHLEYPIALDILRNRVLPERQNDPEQMKRWWQFHRTRRVMRSTISKKERFAVCGLTGKRLILSWAESNWRPSHACGVFAFDDDYNFGVCSSQVHEIWTRANSSTLEDRLRYTPTTAFETFPFPTSDDGQKVRISVAAESIIRLRRAACDSIGAGLTKVYNLMDDGGFVELKAAHRELDLAVADAYGWDAAMLDDPARLLDALFDLNAQCSSDPNYRPFASTSVQPSLLNLEENELDD